MDGWMDGWTETCDMSASCVSCCRIVCLLGDATGYPTLQTTNLEVCVKECQPDYRALKPRAFTFVVSILFKCIKKEVIFVLSGY